MFDIASKACGALVLIGLAQGVAQEEPATSAGKTNPPQQTGVTAQAETDVRARLEAFTRIGHGRQTLGDFLREAADHVAIPLVIAPAVTEKTLERFIDLELQYSRLADALALAGELGDVQTHLTNGVLLVRPRGPIPAVLMLLGAGASRSGPKGGDRWRQDEKRMRRRQADILHRIAGLDLEDASLTGLLRAMRDGYHVDFVVSDELNKTQPLITLRRTKLSLNAALGEVSRQAKASWEWRHGAILLSKRGEPQVRTPPAATGEGTAKLEAAGGSQKSVRNPVRIAGEAGRRVTVWAEKVTPGEVLTHLRKKVNTHDDRRADGDRLIGDRLIGDRLISFQGSGMAWEMIDLLKVYPPRSRLRQ